MPNHIDELIEINCDTELTREIFDNISVSSDISPTIEIEGKINDILELTGSFFLNPVIQIDDITIPQIIGEVYEGPSVVIPSVNEQILNTNKKQCNNDIIIEEIPTFWTQNQTGMTFIIGN